MAYQNKSKNSQLAFPWIGQIKKNGQRKRKLCKTKKEALQWEAEQRKVKEVEVSATNTVLLEWATAYLDYANGEGGFVEKTVKEKRHAFKVLFTTIDPYCQVDEVVQLDILKHFQAQAKSRSGNAANKDRKNLRAAWEWGIRFLDMPRENPFAMVDKFAEDRHERRVPTLEEFWKVYDACDTEQDKLMLRMYLETGARREELFRLMWKDVDFKKNQVRLRWKKNQRGQWEDAWLPVRAEFMVLLKQHQKITGLLKFVFLNMPSEDPKTWVPYRFRQRWLINLCNRAGVERFGLHGVRHLFASILAADNRPLVEIQHMLRHGSISTTQRYIHRLKKENREVLESLPDFETRGTKGPHEGSTQLKTEAQC